MKLKLINTINYEVQSIRIEAITPDGNLIINTDNIIPFYKLELNTNQNIFIQYYKQRCYYLSHIDQERTILTPLG